MNQVNFRGDVDFDIGILLLQEVDQKRHIHLNVLFISLLPSLIFYFIPLLCIRYVLHLIMRLGSKICFHLHIGIGRLLESLYYELLLRGIVLHYIEGVIFKRPDIRKIVPDELVHMLQVEGGGHLILLCLKQFLHFIYQKLLSKIALVGTKSMLVQKTHSMMFEEFVYLISWDDSVIVMNLLEFHNQELLGVVALFKHIHDGSERFLADFLQILIHLVHVEVHLLLLL